VALEQKRLETPGLQQIANFETLLANQQGEQLFLLDGSEIVLTVIPFHYSL